MSDLFLNKIENHTDEAGFKNAESYTIELELLHKDGTFSQTEKIISPTFNKEGFLNGFVCVGRDISERKKNEKALRESEERYRRLSEDMPIFVATFNPDGSLTYVNKNLALFAGIEEDEFIYGNFFDMIPVSDQLSVRNKVAGLSFKKPTETHEQRYVDKQGSVFWQRWTIRALYDNQKKLVGYQAVGIDITDMKETERALLQSEYRLRTFINNSDDIIFVKDENLRYTIVNQALERFFNKKDTDIIGKTDFELMPYEMALECEKTDKEALAKGSALTSEEITGDFTVESRKIPIDLENGKTGIGAFIRDISDRKKKEQALKESEERYRRIVETSQEGIWSMDGTRRTTYVNEKLAKMLGYKAREMIGKHVTSIMYNEDIPIHEKRMKNRSEGFGEHYEQKFRHRDDFPVWCMISATPLINEKGLFEGSFAMITDITDKKEQKQH